MSEGINKEVYEKLTPQKKILVDTVLSNLDEFDGLWKKGWAMSGAPESGITGKKYRGTNNFFLTLAAISKGYTDNRWVTFKQMQDKGWSFKKDEEGNSLGKNAGAVIEFFELRDKETKKPLDKHVLDGMTVDEKNEYIEKNVFPLRKYYRVFNGDIIDGIPERKKQEIDTSAYNERAEKLIELWNDTESRILYGGLEAYYHKKTDRIQLPDKADFYSLQEYYATALHEIGHSTGHEKRLNRDMGDGFGTPSYAVEELRAEIASMFLGQDLEISVSDRELQNNKAYIKSWKEAIKDNPNVLFEAIADADKISKFVMAKEPQKEVEPFAIKEDYNDNGEPIYSLYMTSENGQIRQPFAITFGSREELLEEVGKMQQLRFYSGKELKEVGFDELQNISVRQAEAKEVKEYEEQSSEVYIKPSEVAAMSAASATAIAVDMSGKGIDSLTHLRDRDIVERASKTKSGEKFISLYNGITLYKNEEKDVRSLLARIAMFTSDEEQIMRILKSSGQFKESKPNGYYNKLIGEEIRFVEGIKDKLKPPISSIQNSNRGYSGLNSK